MYEAKRVFLAFDFMLLCVLAHGNIRLVVILSSFDEFVDNLGLSGLLGTAGLVFHSWLVLSAKKKTD